MTRSPVRPPAAETAGPAAPLTPRQLGALLLLTGMVGLLAAFVLTVERFRLLENPLYVPSCSISEVLSCMSVMRSDQASAFGVPNSLLGIVGFTAVAATGGAVLAGARLARWYWYGLTAGLLTALLFVHWLAFQTLYRIGALCPYCMVVWVAVIVAAWYAGLHLLARATQPSPDGRSARDRVLRNHLIIPTAWVVLTAAAVYERFWAPWA